MATNHELNPYHHFLRLVWKMRKAQKDYFKYKSQSALTTSKSLEMQVDKWLEQASFEAAKIKQMGFSSEEPQKGS